MTETSGAAPPLGLHLCGDRLRVAVHAPYAERVKLCVERPGGDVDLFPLTGRDGPVRCGEFPAVPIGRRYALQVDDGPLLADPYARAFDPDDTTGGIVPWSVVLAEPAPREHAHPRHAWTDTVIYETHVRGFSITHPAVPQELRGTYAGLAHPASISHLRGLGVTAVELLPVHEFATEPRLRRAGLTNYWGYNSYGFFAPHARYAAVGRRGHQIAEFRAMVGALHNAGLEVILDVVYNHSAEGDETGPTLCFRALDDTGYYRRDAHGYVNHTGCGNTFDVRQPHVHALILDSLRYWVQVMGVDGFRFDLAPVLGRTGGPDGAVFDAHAPLLRAIAEDPALHATKLIAEPWDLGPGGQQQGAFAPPWREWNGAFRDDVRDAFRGRLSIAALATRFTGSADLFGGGGPLAAINYVTSHDGFSLADLVAFDHKHNAPNAEDGRDGETENRSWNSGVEGPTGDPEVLRHRDFRLRGLIASLLLARGVPMLRGGDELGVTQHGNNNAYCHDDESSWLDWSDHTLVPYVAGLLAVRRGHPVLRGPDHLDGAETAWLRTDGATMSDHDWADPTVRTVALHLPREELLLWLNPKGESAEVIDPYGHRTLTPWSVTPVDAGMLPGRPTP